MKKILITGKTSYVGTSLEKWLRNYPDRYSIDSISLRTDLWKLKDFSEFDVVVHVAGIAHIKETKENAQLYYQINRDLAYDVAQKAKNEGVKQFIFLSSMSVYGIETGVIDKETPLNPKSNYGKSKLEAENLISNLESSFFRVLILRPPMVYGKGCKGNYPKLANIALKIPVFPYSNNKRSMVYIDNLTEVVRFVIDNCTRGILLPQNPEYVNTSEMVKLIAKVHGKRIWITKLLIPFLKIMKNNRTVNKVFGDLVYKETSSVKKEMQFNNLISFEESIKLTEDLR